MPNDWRTVLKRIEDISQEVEAPAVRATVDAFVRAASALPAPDDAGLGYWRTSLRLIWPSVEVEIFPGSIEIYRFTATGTQISTIPFAVGDALPASLTDLQRPNGLSCG